MSEELKTKPEESQENKSNRPIDYKDVRFLSRFVSERGKIIPCRVNSQSVKRQREISQAIKRARILALMPFISK
ncbi:MAG: 30S ribosomal protein S18 [Holosporales bacterium]|jgi:small subunit ribosomal protein S18|nr:30S ribosomal protein S18 [Holosporales bacterium]